MAGGRELKDTMSHQVGTVTLSHAESRKRGIRGTASFAQFGVATSLS